MKNEREGKGKGIKDKISFLKNEGSVKHEMHLFRGERKKGKMK